ncbi:MAG: glycoside hydrolase family 25 protein [Bacillota bacterium]|nr:glycoside hydrolase family 25 protein [Bacillota bacterium]
MPERKRAARQLNNKNIIILLSFLCLILLLALLICLGVLISLDPPAPAVTEEEEESVPLSSLVRYADTFNVSSEYLQTILPSHLFYRDQGVLVCTPLDERLPLHDHSWDSLVYDFGRIRYEEEGRPVSYGVDISYFQGNIDWQAVATDGIDFAMVRLGYRGYSEGGIFEDEFARANLQGAEEAGLELGAYFFSQAINEEEALEEAEFVLELLEGRELSYPIAFDMEEIDDSSARTANLSVEQRSKITESFCSAIEKAGYQAIIYGNIPWLAGRLDLPSLREYPLWLAQYYERPLFPYAFSIWQYTESGQVAGISTPVDLNICFTPDWD